VPSSLACSSSWLEAQGHAHLTKWGSGEESESEKEAELDPGGPTEDKLPDATTDRKNQQDFPECRLTATTNLSMTAVCRRQRAVGVVLTIILLLPDQR
jgi:hypothetical protein